MTHNPDWAEKERKALDSVERDGCDGKDCHTPAHVLAKSVRAAKAECAALRKTFEARDGGYYIEFIKKVEVDRDTARDEADALRKERDELKVAVQNQMEQCQGFRDSKRELVAEIAALRKELVELKAHRETDLDHLEELSSQNVALRKALMPFDLAHCSILDSGRPSMCISLSDLKAASEAFHSDSLAPASVDALRKELIALKEMAGKGDYVPSWRQENTTFRIALEKIRDNGGPDFDADDMAHCAEVALSPERRCGLVDPKPNEGMSHPDYSSCGLPGCPNQSPK